MLIPEFKLRLWWPLLAGCTAIAVPARAQQLPPRPSPVRFVLRPVPDGALALAGAALAALPLVLSDSLDSPCPCQRADLIGLDRRSVGPVASGASRFSNAALVATGAYAGMALILARPGEPWQAAAEDVAVLGQAVLLANGMTEVLKTVIARPRPYVYDSGPTGRVTRFDVEAMPSAHSAQAFAAAAAFWSIQRRRGTAGRHRRDIVALLALATATAVLRVEAHQHFPTDVLAGAALGSTIGWIVPRLHRTRREAVAP